MVPVLPSEIDPNGVYKSGQACRLLGIGTTTLWRYTRDGIITPGHRPCSKENLYLGRDLIKLHRIKY